LNLLGVAFGIGAALTWGSADFGAGLASRKLPALATMVLSQAIGLAIAVVIVVVFAEAMPGPEPLAWSVVGGTSGMVCLLALYRALATRPMGLISAIATVVGVALPVIVGTLSGDLLRTQDVAGIALALVAIALVTRPSGDMRVDRVGLGLAVLSGVGAAGFFISMGRCTDAGGGTWWPIVVARSTSLILALLLTLGRRQVRQTAAGLSPLLVVVGVLDMAGNAFFLLANSQGALSLAVVVSSQYPAVTTILAGAILAQRPGRVQVAGIITALLGIGLISLR
jgi:drug/metabolite transporter (DMT)-like permease